MEWLKWPNEDLDYVFDFSERLETGETIANQTVTASEGLTAHDVSQSGGMVTVWLSGGESGQYYSLTCLVVTSANRTFLAAVALCVR